jgi:Na+-driven multidrug efflux pump
MSGIDSLTTLKIFSNIKKKREYKNKTLIKASVTLTIIFTIIEMVFIFVTKDCLSYLYISNDIEISNKVSHILFLFGIFIIFDNANNLCKSIINGYEQNNYFNLVISLLQIFVFIPLGLLLAFSFKLRYAGFWYSIFTSMVISFLIGISFLSVTMKNDSNALKKEDIDIKLNN